MIKQSAQHPAALITEFMVTERSRRNQATFYPFPNHSPRLRSVTVLTLRTSPDSSETHRGRRAKIIQPKPRLGHFAVFPVQRGQNHEKSDVRALPVISTPGEIARR